MIKEKSRRLFRKKKYRSIALISGLLYLLISLYLIQFSYTSFEAFFSHGTRAYIELFLMIIIAILFSINMMFVFYTFSNIKQYAHQTGTGIFSAAIGLLVAGCPACTIGILALAIPYIGAVITLPILPLKGIEFQLIGIAVLIMGLHFLAKDLSCE